MLNMRIIVNSHLPEWSSQQWSCGLF